MRVESFQPQDTGRDPCRKRGHNLCTLREGRSLGPVTVLYQEKAESASARGGRARNCHSAPSIGTGQVSLWRRGEEMMKKKTKQNLTSTFEVQEQSLPKTEAGPGQKRSSLLRPCNKEERRTAGNRARVWRKSPVEAQACQDGLEAEGRLGTQNRPLVSQFRLWTQGDSSLPKAVCARGHKTPRRRPTPEWTGSAPPPPLLCSQLLRRRRSMPVSRHK